MTECWKTIQRPCSRWLALAGRSQSLPPPWASPNTAPSAQADDDGTSQEWRSVPFIHYIPGYQVDMRSHRKAKKIEAGVRQGRDPNPGRRATETCISQDRRCCRASLCPPWEQAQVTTIMAYIRARGWSKPMSQGRRFPSV